MYIKRQYANYTNHLVATYASIKIAAQKTGVAKQIQKHTTKDKQTILHTFDGSVMSHDNIGRMAGRFLGIIRVGVASLEI